MENNEIMVSIVSITYNHEKYIRQCLDGFMMQKTNFAFEVLIHDDASTDKTADIIREYEAKYPDIIKPVYQKENQYSEGIEIISTYLYPNAKGKYIAFCEGDDYWIDPLKLQKQVDFMETHLDYSMCFHNALIHWEDEDKQDSLFFTSKDRDYTGVEIYEKWTIPTTSTLLRSNVVINDKFRMIITNPHFIYGDIITFLWAAKSGKIYGMSDVMAVYRRHKGGIVYGENIKRSIAECRHDNSIGKIFEKDVRKVSKRLRSLKYNGICLYYKNEKKLFKLFYYFLCSFCADPLYVMHRLIRRLKAKF